MSRHRRISRRTSKRDSRRRSHKRRRRSSKRIVKRNSKRSQHIRTYRSSGVTPPYEVGDQIVARFSEDKNEIMEYWYHGTISRVRTTGGTKKTYLIEYNDGDKKMNVPPENIVPLLQAVGPSPTREQLNTQSLTQIMTGRQDGERYTKFVENYASVNSDKINKEALYDVHRSVTTQGNGKPSRSGDKATINKGFQDRITHMPTYGEDGEPTAFTPPTEVEQSQAKRMKIEQPQHFLQPMKSTDTLDKLGALFDNEEWSYLLNSMDEGQLISVIVLWDDGLWYHCLLELNQDPLEITDPETDPDVTLYVFPQGVRNKWEIHKAGIRKKWKEIMILPIDAFAAEIAAAKAEARYVSITAR